MSHQQTDAETAQRRVQELETAIHRVLDQDMDDICWMDVYTMLGTLVGREVDFLKLPKEQFDKNCARFSLALYAKTPYNPDDVTNYIHTLQRVAEEHRQAKMMLDKAGYGVTGTPLLVRLKEALDRLESYDNEDIPGEDN